MRWSDVLPALLMLALSAAMAIDTRGLSFWADTTPGPRFVPLWLAVAGVLLVVLRLVEARGASGAPVQWPGGAALGRVGRVLAGLVAVPLMAPLVGLVAALALFVGFLLLFVLRQPLWQSLATVLITIGLVYGIFVAWLGVALPTGVLGF
jgi:putative tricarboxylic transport membrane protein